VGDLIRRFCAVTGRFGFRVGGVDCVGHVFITGGRVIHAEYGEDYGLDALMQMLRAGPLWIETWAGPWPRQDTLHLSADVLLGSTLRPGPSTESIAPDDTGVVRKVVLPEPDPLPSFEDEPSPPGVTLSTRLARALSLAPPALHSTPPCSTQPPPAEAPSAETLPAKPLPGEVLLEELLRTGPPSLLPSAAAADGEGDTSEAEPPIRPEPEGLTTMVRLTSRGLLLAARGDNVARLADAASLIHGLANLIAVDLGRRRTATVHLRGRTKSMFVTRSEVHDIAAVYGPTQRLAPLLDKLGLR
jgi:hypothetical protein